MLGWLFPPKCPCDPAAKAWIERRLEWLGGQFDNHAFNGQPVVLPTAEFFPAPYDGSDETVRNLLDQVCGYMGVAPELIRLEIVAYSGAPWLVNDRGQYLPHAAGTYEEGEEQFLIRIDKSALGDPMELVGTMAHELSHVRLLGEGRIDYEIYDNELLTDLTVVFLGMGIFLANLPRNWDSHYSTWPDSSLRKPEYMSPPMFGYALGHLAWFQEERRPPWARHLHWNAWPDFKESSRFLFETGNSTFAPRRLHVSP